MEAHSFIIVFVTKFKILERNACSKCQRSEDQARRGAGVAIPEGDVRAAYGEAVKRCGASWGRP